MRAMRVVRVAAVAVVCVLFGAGLAFGETAQPVQVMVGAPLANQGISVTQGSTVLFPNTRVGGTMTFTLVNNSGSDLTLSGDNPISITGSGAKMFSVAQVPGSSLAAGASENFALAFSPAAGGIDTAAVSIALGDGQPPINFTVVGLTNTHHKVW